MATTGTTIVDFGAFPGAAVTSVDVTGQTTIAADSFVEAWVVPTLTTDHTADEHLVDPPRVIAGDIVAGVGFTIWAFDREEQTGGPSEAKYGLKRPLPWGKWSVAWVWT